MKGRKGTGRELLRTVILKILKFTSLSRKCKRHMKPPQDLLSQFYRDLPDSRRLLETLASSPRIKIRECQHDTKTK